MEIYYNLWDTIKSSTKRRVYGNKITYIKNAKRSQINNISLHLKELDKTRAN
jgi:hypothetical protein